MKIKGAFMTASIVIALLIAGCRTSNRSDDNYAVRNWDSKEAMLQAMRWQEAHPIYAKGPADWTNGAYYTGVYRAHMVTQDTSFLNTLKTMALRNEWQPAKRFYHADDLRICAAYLYLHSIGYDKVNLTPTDTIIHDHLYKPHEWKEGNTDSPKQILWWWCDALFMTPPVLVTYAEIKNDQLYLDEMHKYFMETYHLLFDEEENLFARDLKYVWTGDDSDVKEPNGKKVFWSRGNGWVLAGLALILEDMPADFAHRPFYVELFQKMATRILDLQPSDGLWRTSLLSPETFDHGEVSGSGFYTFALAWGINNGVLERDTFEPAVEKAWKAIRNCQQESGMVGWVQNIGASPEPANKDSWQNFGTGAFLMAGSEILKLNAGQN